MIRNTIFMCALALVVGCGGGSKKGETTTGAKVMPANVARTTGGDAITTSSGDGVTKRAHSRWKSAADSFDKAEKEGWTPVKCRSVSNAFDNAAGAQSGGFGEALFMSGLARQRCGDKADARKAYEKALRANPKLCEARVALAVDDMKAGRTSKARSEFERAIKDDPQCTSGYTNLAIIQRTSGDKRQRDEALKNLRRALAIDSDYLPAFNQMALLYYERGKDGRDKASLDLAEVVCRQAQLVDDKYAPIYNTWGQVKISKGDVIEALRFFEQAASLDPNMFEAQMNFGQITSSFRGYADAERAFSRAVALRPNDYDAAIGLGTALRGLEKFSEAQSQYEKARGIDAQRPEAYFNLGVLYQDYMSGSVADLTKAKGYFQEFLRRAGGKAGFKKAVSQVSDRCRTTKRRRGRAKCRPGRMQNIDTTIDALKSTS